MHPSSKNIVIIGPAFPLRGGLATFNERMAKQMIDEGDNVKIYTFSLQYPKILFPGKTQFSKDPPPAHLDIEQTINSVNPISWFITGNKIKHLKPDIVIVRYWLPFMAPCLGTIARIIKKNKHSKILCLVDNLIPHEKRIGDKQLTTYFVKPFDGFITMSRSVFNDTKKVTKSRVILKEHPIIDNFGQPINKQEARKYLKLNPNDHYILFFGFIRKYKGLDMLIEAIKILKNKHAQTIPKLIVAGEFYEDNQKYLQLIDDLDLKNDIILHTDFIENEKVKYYVSACDFVIQPYRSATQSGVTPLAYHFEKPMLVTNVGGLPDIVPNGETGIVTEPNATSIAEGIETLYSLNEADLIENVKREKQKYSWENFTNAIKNLAE